MTMLALAIVFFTFAVVIIIAIFATYYYFNNNKLGTLAALCAMVGVIFLSIYLIQNL